MFNRKSSYALNKKDPDAIVYSPLCCVAPILPAQPPFKVRYHALTGFPVSVFM